mmetsp:Transcript_94762/g.203603  ORF Transcript_94762/g.203603 Transcript_94762/m.203603 type:complete len:574 (+) Transcript_94762:135-1856(+)
MGRLWTLGLRWLCAIGLLSARLVQAHSGVGRALRLSAAILEPTSETEEVTPAADAATVTAAPDAAIETVAPDAANVTAASTPNATDLAAMLNSTLRLAAQLQHMLDATAVADEASLAQNGTVNANVSREFSEAPQDIEKLPADEARSLEKAEAESVSEVFSGDIQKFPADETRSLEEAEAESASPVVAEQAFPVVSANASVGEATSSIGNATKDVAERLSKALDFTVDVAEDLSSKIDEGASEASKISDGMESVVAEGSIGALNSVDASNAEAAVPGSIPEYVEGVDDATKIIDQWTHKAEEVIHTLGNLAVEGLRIHANNVQAEALQAAVHKACSTWVDWPAKTEIQKRVGLNNGLVARVDDSMGKYMANETDKLAIPDIQKIVRGMNMLLKESAEAWRISSARYQLRLNSLVTVVNRTGCQSVASKLHEDLEQTGKIPNSISTMYVKAVNATMGWLADSTTDVVSALDDADRAMASIAESETDFWRGLQNALFGLPLPDINITSSYQEAIKAEYALCAERMQDIGDSELHTTQAISHAISDAVTELVPLLPHQTEAPAEVTPEPFIIPSFG